MPITLGTLASSGVKTRLEYQTYVYDGTAKTTYTFSGVSFGAAESGRVVVVQATSTSGIVTGVTIGGVTATLVYANDGSASSNNLYRATVPSGTSGSVVLSTTGGPNAAGIIVWSLYGVNATPKSSGEKATSSDFPALSLAAGDIVICGDWTGTSVTYTNATKNVGYTIASAEATGASYRATSAETRTISNNVTGGTFFSYYAVWGR